MRTFLRHHLLESFATNILQAVDDINVKGKVKLLLRLIKHYALM